MLARGVVVAGVVAAVVALTGCRRDSAEQTDVSPLSIRAYAPTEVKRAFRAHGLPLRDPWWPGSPPPRKVGGQRAVFDYPRGGPVFRVAVYDTAWAAQLSQGLVVVLVPPHYRYRGQILTARKANVVVTYETGRPVVRSRVRAALASLS